MKLELECPKCGHEFRDDLPVEQGEITFSVTECPECSAELKAWTELYSGCELLKQPTTEDE